MTTTIASIAATTPVKHWPTSADTNKQFSGLDILNTLTPADKKLLEAATGSQDLINNREALLLATRIALDRYMGNLTGEIDKSYVLHLVREQKEALVSSEQKISYSASIQTLDKALTFLYLEHPTVGVNIDTRV